MFHQIFLIFLITVCEIICQDNINFDLLNSSVEGILTTRPPSRYIDIYTNHHNLQDVLRNYNAINRQTNSRYLELDLPHSGHHSIIKDRHDYHYNSPKSPSKKHDDLLESDFGVIVATSKNRPSMNHLTSINNSPIEDKLIFNRERRPRFKTQKYNWTNANSSNHFSRFSYIQKIPKQPSTSNNGQTLPLTVNNQKDITKERINEMLKKYLSKLYSQKYQNYNVSRPLTVYPQDNNLKSKFFEETLWNLKNKTKLLASKLFGLFTVIQFSNSHCTTSSSAGQYEGICYTQAECDSLSGTAMGNCASGYGVCCVFRGTCGGSGQQNCSYFESPDYPNYYPSDGGVVVPTTQAPGLTPDPRLEFYYGTRSPWARQSGDAFSCTYNVYKLNDNIQQMRIDFLDLELTGPTNGTCVDEQLVISGQNLNTQVPVICGYNTGQHVYVDVSTLSGPLQLSVLSATGNSKRFKIRICQYESSCMNSNNCLQYYTGVTGTISSFNYDQAIMLNRSVPGYFNNLNYAICIRREAGYCSITYTNVMNGVEYPFQMVNVNDDGTSTIPAGQAGVDITDCPDDYIVIGGTRLCGDKFNDGSVDEDFTLNEPVTDTSAGPIVVQVRTDSSVTGMGFKLFYTQNRCT